MLESRKELIGARTQTAQRDGEVEGLREELADKKAAQVQVTIVITIIISIIIITITFITITGAASDG